jgi:hydroxymethylpyrimidine/phosphomethylpyrimidine kinase
MTPVALTIAGSDPSGGAGLQADLKTFQQHGVYGMSVVTLLTVQNTQRVSNVQVVSPELVLAQFEAVLADITPNAVKTGALGSVEVIEAIAAVASDVPFPLVVDPVMISKHGDTLLPAEAVQSLRARLLPHATIVTPNRAEAAALAELVVETVADMERAAATIARSGVRNVLVKGGRQGDACVDVLFADGELHRFAAPWVDTPHTHGSGCVFAAAITAGLARGLDLPTAIQGAKGFISAAVQDGLGLGHGRGPVNTFVAVR